MCREIFVLGTLSFVKVYCVFSLESLLICLCVQKAPLAWVQIDQLGGNIESRSTDSSP